MSNHPPRFRFAPSPNGLLHIGHAFSALKTQQLARQIGGDVLLRIEDIDIDRSRDAFVQEIYNDLEWIGFSWSGDVLHQSKNLPAYENATAKLADMNLLYSCYATRKEITAAARADPMRDPDGAPLYPGRGSVLSKAETKNRQQQDHPHTLRLDMHAAIKTAKDISGSDHLSCQTFGNQDDTETTTLDPAAWGDVVLVRKDTPTSYHLSVTVDDAAQGITHVTRGKDLEAATAIHRLLQVLLDLPEPVYHHHDLIMADAIHKLSKSSNDLSLQAMRASGLTAQDIWTRIGISPN